jgi:hypothetical protein
MSTRSRPIRLSLALIASVAAALALSQRAHADIYTWVDASGAVNVTNLPPPKTARVINVVAESPRPVVTPADLAAAAARQEARALAERVQELERQVEQARAVPPPPPVVYAPAPVAPTVVQYFTEPVQQQPANTGCDAGWNGCGVAAGSFLYPPTVVIFGGPRIRPIDNLHRQRGVPGHWPVMGANSGFPRAIDRHPGRG